MPYFITFIIALVLVVGGFFAGGLDIAQAPHFDSESTATTSPLTDAEEGMTEGVSIETREPKPAPETLNREAITPGPLTGPEEAESPMLTREGVVAWTNAQRVKNGLPPLSQSYQLHQSATAKLGDMFEYQYFAHESPNGEDVSVLVEQFDYAYLLVGENLALGNFDDDGDLVEAWMNSPGHRANILNQEYTEIGVSVQQGVYRGRMTWIAVQHFATPRSHCPSVDSELKERIDDNKEKLDDLLLVLEEKKELYESYSQGSHARAQAIEEYNEVVNTYNALLEDTRDLIARYNADVDDYNECIEEIVG